MSHIRRTVADPHSVVPQRGPQLSVQHVYFFQRPDKLDRLEVTTFSGSYFGGWYNLLQFA